MTKKAAVIGHPVAHSKSPLIHNYWIKKYGIDAAYEAIDIAPENLEKEIMRLIDEGYAGFNVTIPHKERVFEICDAWDDLARAVGAVNTAVIEGKNLKGLNTDVFGFVENIRAARPTFDFRSGAAVVLGAGGAARAVVQGLLQQGAPEIRAVNRSKDKAQILARDFKKLRVFEWEQLPEILNDANLLVNTTSLGMKGQPQLEIDLAGLNKNALANDIVYTPLYTNFLAQAEANGNPVVTGIGMLLQQARPAFEAWFGVMPEIDAELERLVLS